MLVEGYVWQPERNTSQIGTAWNCYKSTTDKGLISMYVSCISWYSLASGACA